MRFLIALLILLLLVWHFWPEPEPVPVEKTFIAEPVQRLREAEQFEAQYLEATEARKRQLEKELEEQTGGG